uniref:hypothetical protein n=1 Tax=Gemella haemolysans TaxID=1379 RepID=UPI002930A737|nr:hypothetical protein [Gemella haemolysans]
MLNKKIKIALSIISILTMIITSYCILMSPKVLTRENNKGNEFEQLDRLMNTTRYAEQIRKAGYQVDDYNLKMMDRVPKLKTSGENQFIILSPTEGSLDIYSETYNEYIEFDKDMNLKDGILSEDGKHRSLNDDEKKYYKKMIVEKINRLLDDVYKAGGDNVNLIFIQK